MIMILGRGLRVGGPGKPPFMILGRGLRVGGPGKPPFWRTLEESCKGLGPVTFKINTQHTLGIGRLGSDGFWIRDYGGGVRVGRPFGARRRSPVSGSAR
jgi:hypothetical protein